jgi:uncharacterized membrane protein YraQ (UPF0718 family)
MRAIERYRLIKERLGTPLIFLIGTLLFAGIIWLWKPSIIVAAVPVFITIISQIWHILIIVFALLFILNLFLSPKTVKGWLGEASGWRGWVIAISGGIISSGPIYLWYPFLKDLERHGMRRAYTATFLSNRAVKPALLPLLIAYFGLAYTIILTAYIIIFSIIQGTLIERLVSDEKEVET